MTKQEQFFYTHAGFSWNPQTETEEQGRIRTAGELARAYAALYADMNVGIEWLNDPDADQFDWYGDGQPAGNAYGCVLKRYDPTEKAPPEILASLWSICDPTPTYQKIVEAELAWEAGFGKEPEKGESNALS